MIQKFRNSSIFVHFYKILTPHGAINLSLLLFLSNYSNYMKRYIIRHLTLLLLLLIVIANNSVHAQTVTLSSSADSVSVGDILHLNLKIQLTEQVDDLIFPDSSMFPSELTFLQLEEIKLTDFSDSLSYRVQYFSTQDVFIPSFPIGLISENDTSIIFSNSITIPFKTVLSANDAELRPIKPILQFQSFPWLLLLALIVVLSIFAFVYLKFFKQEPTSEVIGFSKPVPFSNPLVQLENQLIFLKDDYKLSETRDFKYFYTEMSDSIRRYFEDLYNIPALESTTRELLRFLDAFGVDHEMIQSTRYVLNRSDMVKFAKFEPTLENAWNCYADAINFTERAKLIDASRIARKKAEHESQWATDTQENIDQTEHVEELS